MKKFLVALLLCAGASISCNSSKVSPVGRLALLGIFRHARPTAPVLSRKITTASTKQPLYTNEKIAIREFFPAQASPKTAAVRNGLSAAWASLAGFRNSFRVSYSDPFSARAFANIRREEIARNRTLEQSIALLDLFSETPKASAAA